MENQFENKHTDDPNAVTTEDREVLSKKNITPTDVKNALNENNVAGTIASGARFPETGPRLILGILLVVSGILIAVITSATVFGIILGALFVIGGIMLPFSNLGAGRRHTA
ncbi:MAG TPA: hypothetical protein VIL74_10170 [Pyrinomonadaceae bacterium]|jgi:uncharacterized membrane protein